MDPSTPPPLRVYACYIDEMLHTQPFPHAECEPGAFEQEMNRQFQAWLEMTAPGAYDAGRVTGIRFADMTEEQENAAAQGL